MPTVPLDSAGAVKLLGDLGVTLNRFPGEMEMALVRGLNRTATAVKRGAVKILTDRYTAQRSDIQRKIRIEKASGRNLGVMIFGKGRPIHLGRWNAQTKIVRGFGGLLGDSRKGQFSFTTVNILRGGIRKVVKDAFGGVSAANQHYLIFKRKGDARYPIKGLYGPSMIGHLNKSEQLDELKTLAQKRLEKVMKHEAEFRLKKLGAL